MADLNAASNPINLAAVKRVDPYARDILERASQVALYTFNGDRNEWKKTEVEGALFVYSRTGEPYHNILIMNRLSTQNLMEPVVQGLDIQRQAPFLLYRNTKCDIYGIWFYDKEECVRIADVLDHLVKEAPVSKCPPQPVSKPAPVNVSVQNNNNVDIFSMLSKAQEDYYTGKGSALQNPSHEPQSAETPQTVLDFFAKASTSSNKPPVAQPAGMFVNQHPGQRVPAPETNDPNLKPILQRLMSNPVHSVEHIEKQQRSVTPQQAEIPSLDNKSAHKEQKKSGFKLKPMKENGRAKPLAHTTGSPASNSVSSVTNGINFLRISPTNAMGSQQPHVGGVLASPRTPGGPAPAPLLDSRPDVTPKPALMPPVMFTSSPAVDASPQQASLSGLQQNHPVQMNFGDLPSHQVQMNFSDLSNMVRATQETHQGQVKFSDLPNVPNQAARSPPLKPEPLTKNQLLQAFHYLLKNDPDFVNTLHEAYVKSFSEIAP